jgi:hypothetical protein
MLTHPTPTLEIVLNSVCRMGCSIIMWDVVFFIQFCILFPNSTLGSNEEMTRAFAD